MAKSLLTVKGIDSLKKIGRHADGEGLYLIVEQKKKETGVNKRWVARYFINGRARETGLGGYPSVALAEARERNDTLRKQLRSGVDPLEAKRQERVDEKKKQHLTFGDAADQLIETKSPGWKNEKHAAQWKMTLKKYAAPLRSLRVDEVTTQDILKVIKPLWHSVPETAGRLRMRIEAVLDYARAHGFIEESKPNPARFKGHLEHLLPKRQNTTKHYGSLPYADLPVFMKQLREVESVTARALEFTILTAGRTSEITGADWAEIDLEKKLWTIPKDRMKASRDHEVPLSARAVVILELMKEIKSGEIVFSGRKPGTPMSNMTMASLLDRLLNPAQPEKPAAKKTTAKSKPAEQDPPTVHGFRATFKTWCSDHAKAEREIAEHALAHNVGNKVEMAYQRTTLLELRRELMNDWADYCASA
jgi:integrase